MKIRSRKFSMSIFSAFVIVACQAQAPKEKPKENSWFPSYDFDAATFQKAPREFGPLTRWWLPGNDVTKEELQREIKMLAENGFAGVEVQPLTMGLNLNGSKERVNRIMSWDTPSFYEHMKAIMEQAKQSEMIVDMNGGSGWPLGGSFFDPNESMRTLAVSDTAVKGGQTFNGPVPKLDLRQPKLEGRAAMLAKNPVEEKWATLLSVIAAKVIKQSDKQAVIDPSSIIDLMKNGEGRNIKWTAPGEGEWRIIASWSVPSGEKPSLIASAKTNYVIDHLDTAVVNKTYNYLLGDRTGLTAYYKSPLRAIFNDSYEFHTDRMVSSDFLQLFREINGYDVAPYLSTVFQKGYNHPTYLASMYPGAKPPYAISEAEGWRVMHDYDITVNEAFNNKFIRASNNWLNKRGMLHRTQAYGFPIDLIESAGAADIPEVEQLFAEGSEGYLKLVTSGAHLYNRPVITQESFVSILRAEMTTPQKIKIWADKSFACGVNQLIYHGTPYKYSNDEYGREGWNTWSSPFNSFINFSTGMNESDPFWKDIKAVNQYLTRSQYALRSGKPKTDVLIYMPFNNFTEDQLAVNPAEILYRGYFEGVEPNITGFGVFEAPATAINTWYKKLWPLVNNLEANGISWEFVNDESLQRATHTDGKIYIGENQYQALVLANLPYINLISAKKINTLSKQGLAVWTLGELPKKQPSFHDYEANDKLTSELMKEVANQKTTVGDNLPLKSIEQKIRFSKPVDFSRQITREMADGSQLKFIWNKTDQWQTISLTVDASFLNSYWINPEDGKSVKSKDQSAIYNLPPYGSILFFASTKPIDNNLISEPAPSANGSTETLSIPSWSIQAGDVSVQNSPLFDWRDRKEFQFKSDEGVYTSTFTLASKKPTAHYFIDLGKVFFCAAVSINGRPVGKRLFAPYQLDITEFVKAGKNQVEVRITTTRRNEFVGEGVKGNPKYAQFKGKENTLLPSGLVGPVKIMWR